MAKASAAASIIFQVIDRPPLVDSLSDEGESPLELPAGDIEFRGVQFAYPGGGDRVKSVVLGGKTGSPSLDSPYLENDESSKWDADGLTLSFPRNKTTAIVGPSGAGKSTIAALLERWYEPQIGSISIGDTDIADLNLRYWRSKIGFVMQEPFLFNDTIYMNVAYGLQGTMYEGISESGKRQMVHEACVEANAAEFINELPDMYDSLVGEGGIKLSGGQKQRIAIARSIISKPPILVLDEATSALDPINEQLIHKALEKISKGRTTIMIAHRLSTLKNADKIIVLEKGNIVESGTHSELMESATGVYRASVGLQALVIDTPSAEDPFRDPEVQGEEEDIIVIPAEGACLLATEEPDVTTKWKEMGIFSLVWLILTEQSRLWPVYTAGLAGALGSGIALPMSGLLLASFLITFDLAQAGEMALFEIASTFWAHMFMVLAVGTGLMCFLMAYMLTRSSYISGSHYRSEYFRNIISQKIPFFDKSSNSSGELTSKLDIYPGAIQELIGIPAGAVVSSFATFVSSCIISIYICPKLAVAVILACVPLNLLAGWAKIWIERRFVGDSMDVFAESSQFATEAVGAYRTVSSLCLERPIVQRFKKLLSGHVKKQSFRVLWSSVFYSATESSSILTSAFTFWWGGNLIIRKEISVFQFYVVYLTVLQAGDAVGIIFNIANKMALAILSANKMFEVRPAHGFKPLGKRLNQQERGGCTIEFKDVYFGYSDRNLNVFNGLNLKIEKGQFVALVGPSGCGKSTIISLLERFYDVSRGDILIDGQSLAPMDVGVYRNAVSLVAQEPTIYQGTIRENICIGAAPNVTEKEIIQAARDAYLHDFVSSLPDGYNTLCGNRGIGLSGGQKQRLSIARALIRKPRILLLDEATASLDSDSERIVQRALEGVDREIRQMTTVAVAHRISSIKNADVIFVLNEGRVVEQGTHDTLIRKRGMYYEMCQAQALDC
ncbi:MDR efflux pump ABC3 [Morchella snyderi]|nr:MDR efflux pump ABC3 [Morchella snyderi]